MKQERIVFMGTPTFSVTVLEGLKASYHIVGVVTQPDKEVGRKKILTPSPVKEFAMQNNIPVLQPVKIREDYQPILDLKPDLIITCAYGQIIPATLLEAPRLGCINVHASLLPKLRGGAPIQRAIMNGAYKTGITIMDMVEKMDAGDIIAQEETIIKEEDTYGSLNERLSKIGCTLLLKTLPSILDKSATRTKQQEEEVTYAFNIKREEEHLDFEKTTKELYDQIRGLNPVPATYASLDGKVWKIYKAKKSSSFYTEEAPGSIARIYKDAIGVATKDGELLLQEIQLEGKRKMTVKEYFNGIDEMTLLGKRLK